ncbi:MAG: ribbon-helix-helix domain-containing protein [Caulobacteraceae bacterium]
MLQKKSVTLSGHETSLALEAEFWTVLQDMAAVQGQSLAALIRGVDESRGPRALASACRVTALAWAARKALANP